MKRLLGLIAFVFLISVPAYGQSKGATVGGSSPMNNNASGAGGGGGGTSGSAGGRLPSYPPARFDVAAFSGSTTDFVPSAFLSFDQAVARGTAVVVANTRTVAEMAAENSATPKAKAKFTFVQDAQGNVVTTPRQ
jgi:hypothetical protein